MFGYNISFHIINKHCLWWLTYVCLAATIPLYSSDTIITSKFTEHKLSSSFFPSLLVRSLNANSLRTLKDKLGEEYLKNWTTVFSSLLRIWDSPKHILQWTYRRGNMMGRKTPRNMIEGSLHSTNIICSWLIQV